MNTGDFDEKVLSQIKALQNKFDAMGQDLSSYLDGLLYARYLSYWDYINLDTLLSLQQPQTDFPDEKIFIVYHQITELYFQLVLHEIRQLAALASPGPEAFVKHITRINRYFKQLANSFEIMVEGMEHDQFLKFRMSLLPSSGFQSVQYRKIEICATDFAQLLAPTRRKEMQQQEDLELLMEHIYWKSGASELSTGKKTLTLRQFEEKYHQELLELASEFRQCNLRQLHTRMEQRHGQHEGTRKLLREFDHLANVVWPLSHYRSAARHLQRDPEVISATGGTNWQKYLPPRFQRVFFFPELWSPEELKAWGRSK